MSKIDKQSNGRPTSLILETWKAESPATARSFVPQKEIAARSYSVAATLCGLLGALAIHVAFVGVVIGGFDKPIHRSKVKPGDAIREPLILITPVPQVAPVFSLTALAPDAIDDPALLIDRRRLAIPPSLVDIDDPIDQPTDDDGYVRQKQFGVYTGQIAARVERAWSRPRTEVSKIGPSEGSAEFECLVKILQSESGAVLEVDLLSCNGTADWQQSLVRAIFAASPLPAPPSPQVFANALTLTFSAHEFHGADAEDGYAPITSNRGVSSN
jgi:hypothetical protein